MRPQFLLALVLVAAVLPGVVAGQTTAPENETTAEDVRIIVEKVGPETASPDAVATVRDYLATGGNLSEPEREAARAWLRNTTVSPSTSTPTATATPEAPPPSNDTVRARIGPSATLKSWNFEDGRFRLVIESDIPQRVKVTDVGAMIEATESRGVAEIPTKGVTLDAGETVIVFDVTSVDGEGYVSVATGGGAVQVSSGSSSGTLESIAAALSTWQGIITGTLTMFSWTVVASAMKLREEQAGVRKAGDNR
jgi:hypothetical protein